MILDKLDFVPDFVGCSSLTRAAQTAYHIFPKQEIHVLPYLCESSSFIPTQVENQGYRRPTNTAYPPNTKFAAFLT